MATRRHHCRYGVNKHTKKCLKEPRKHGLSGHRRRRRRR